jgi:hypothetical protein
MCSSPVYNRASLLGVCAITVLLIATHGAYASRMDCDYLQVAGGRDWFPITYFDPITKQPLGQGYQLVQQLGKQLGIPIRFKPNIPWPRVLAMARNGSLDIIAGLAGRLFSIDCRYPTIKTT